MPLSRRTILALAASATLLALGVAAYWLTTAPERAFAAFMADAYGSYDAKEDGWSQPGDAAVVHSICARKSVRIESAEHILLAVCGATRETGSHGEQGSVDFYVLKADGGRLTIAAELLEVASGSFGTPGKVTPLQLGPAFHGFLLEEGWTGQGYTLGTTRLFIPSTQGIREGLTIRSLEDETGTGQCDEPSHPCTNLSRTVAVSQASDGKAVFPLVIHESGIADGKPVDRQTTIPFDRKRWRYPTPARMNP